MSEFSPTPITTCDRCGAEIPPGAKFCNNCGQPVSANRPEAPVFAPRPQQALPETYPDVYSGVPESDGGIGKLFSASGRISRLEYFLTILGVWALAAVAAGLIYAIDAPALTIVLGLGGWLLAAIVSICAGIKRLHDFDQTGWLYLLFLIPFVSFIMLLLLFLKGPSPGRNAYGFEDSGSVMG